MIRIVALQGDAMPKAIAGKKVLIKFGQELLERLDKAAEEEERTRSELIREAVRRYLKMPLPIFEDDGGILIT